MQTPQTNNNLPTLLILPMHVVLAVLLAGGPPLSSILLLLQAMVPNILLSRSTSVCGNIFGQKRLWTGVKAWKELTETWLQTPFTEIDASILEKHVTLYQRTCHQAVKGLPSNPVAKRLKASSLLSFMISFLRQVFLTIQPLLCAISNVFSHTTSHPNPAH